MRGEKGEPRFSLFDKSPPIFMEEIGKGNFCSRLEGVSTYVEWTGTEIAQDKPCTISPKFPHEK